MPPSLASPAGGSLALQGDNFVVFNAVGYSVLVFGAILILLFVFYWYGVCGFRWRKLPCVSEVKTFQTFLDPNLVIVKKLFSVLLLKACKQKQKK